MALMSWTDAYSVGVVAIDAWNRRLMELINELHQLVCDGAADEALDASLDRLIQYTQAHFADEENLLRRAGYPEFAVHQAKHEELIAEALRLQQRFRAGAAPIHREALLALRDWMDNHITGSDKEAGRYLTSRRAASRQAT